jgi:hypothetical protein
MVTPVTSYIVENDEDFKKALDRLAATTNDFRIPFGLIAKEFYQSNKKIFSLKSAGKYPDLSPKYKIAKQREVGFVYPILLKTGALAASLLKPNANGSVRTIRKQELLLGTRIPYAKFHQSDEPRTKIPLRKVVFIDGGPLETSSGASTSGRRESWLNIINDYILDTLETFEFGDLDA